MPKRATLLDKPIHLATLLQIDDRLPRQQGNIPQWRSAGYLVKLYLMTLPDPEFAIRRVERRVRFGGHDIPAATIRRRFQRGLENLMNHYLGIVDEWSIYDASANPPLQVDSGDNRPTDKLMEDPVEYRATSTQPRLVKPLDDPDFIGAQEEHHKTRTFQDEYRTFLKKYGIDYEERYVWD